MMRVRVILTTAVAVACLAPASGAQAASSKGKCAFKGSTTVAKNRYARVFTRPSRGDEIERLYGCLYSVNRRVWLDTSSDDEYVTSEEFSDVKLTGRTVTWRHVSTDISCKADCPPGYQPTTERMLMADLRTRKVSAVTGSGVSSAE